MTALADVVDVETKFGPVAADDFEKVTVLLDEAEAQVRQRIPGLDARITAGRTSLVLVKLVLCEMVVGVLQNPEGFRTVSAAKTEGPFSTSRAGTYSSTAGVEGLTLTRRHLRLLGQTQGARTVPVGDPALEHVLRAPAERWDEAGRGFVWPTP